ncbi:glycosyltransferase family 4 protein [Variovorax sp. RHLX14]|uniref:glycosyltransferase family 4 protein n=1 Tax=Variovorax sp. RHLX14 TaxID=1259731 RepID=UPI003F44FFD4
MSKALSHKDQNENGILNHIVINGKFLQTTTSRSGVYRVAKELLVALDKVLLENREIAQTVRCSVVVPNANFGDLKLSIITIENTDKTNSMSPWMRRITGVLWEQLILPKRSKGKTIISLCNIGPIVHRDAFTMVHDAQVFLSPGSYSRLFRTWYRFVLPLLGKRNKAILTVSQYSKEQLGHFKIAPAERINVIHNGCDHVLRLIPDTELIAAKGLRRTPYVVALANCQKHKNISVLLEAFGSPEMSEVTLVLFGPASRDDFERQGHNVPKNVKFLGFVSDEQLAGLLQEAVALAFPSTTEGFGLPPLEAMALGCPAIVAPLGSLPEVCGDAALQADAYDPLQWRHQIIRLLRDEELADELRRRGRQRAAKFTWERSAYQLLETVIGRQLTSDSLTRVR